MGYNNVRMLKLGDSKTITAFKDATHAVKVGSYGFLEQMRFHELNCLFSRGNWFEQNRAGLFN